MKNGLMTSLLTGFLIFGLQIVTGLWRIPRELATLPAWY